MQKPGDVSFSETRLQRFAVFAGVYLFVFGVPYLLAKYGRPFLKEFFSSAWWLVPGMLLAGLASIAPYVYHGFVRSVERGIFARNRRYQKTLVSASAGMSRVKDVRKLCRLIAYMVNQTVGLTHTAVFLLDQEEGLYSLAALRHRAMMPNDVKVRGTHPLIRLLDDRRDLVLLEDLKANLHNAPLAKRGERLEKALEWMERYEVRLVVPSFSNSHLLGFLALGAKRNREDYTTDDIAVFSGLSNQATLAIQNALFFEEIRHNEAFMIQSEKLASLGQLASGMAHEIHNPLTIISGESQLYLERNRGRDPKVDAVFESVIEECKRAADITRRILRFAKPGRAEYEEVDVKAAVQDSLTLAGYQVKLDRFKPEVELPEDLPRVQGNQNQIQEVVLNLVINACHAMAGAGIDRGKILVSATANNGHVSLRVRDEGPGIPPERIKKIFDPFFTTKSTGTGLGLFVSQRIIQSHGGKLFVTSQEGKGTCFTIQLPIAKPADRLTGP